MAKDPILKKKKKEDEKGWTEKGKGKCNHTKEKLHSIVSKKRGLPCQINGGPQAV